MRFLLLLPAFLLVLAACGDRDDDPQQNFRTPDARGTPSSPPKPEDATEPVSRLANGEPERVTVDHILIAVKGPRLPNPRYADPAEAKSVAYAILDELREGGDWAALKDKYTEDRRSPQSPGGGPYTMRNHGVAPREGAQEFDRAGMAGAFGDVGFRLEVGEIEIADHDPSSSPFGYHIIKRVR